MKLKNKNLLKDNSGLAAIEAAFLLPVLLLLIFALIEFGMYFLKDQIALNSIGSISYSVQNSPEDLTIQDQARDSGGVFMNLRSSPNYFCAKSYATYNEAKNGSCNGTVWDTTAPGDADEAYYVALRVYAQKYSVGMLSNFVSDIDRLQIIRVDKTNCTSGMEVLNGTGAWEVPDCVTAVKATIIGAGGGGCVGTLGYYAHSGSGGGGGATVIAYFEDLDPDSSIPYSSGVGGSGGYLKCDGASDGGASRFNNVVAGGGGAGTVKSGEWYSGGIGGSPQRSRGAASLVIPMAGFEGEEGKAGSWYQSPQMKGGNGGNSGGGYGVIGQGGARGSGSIPPITVTDGENGAGGGGGGTISQDFNACMAEKDAIRPRLTKSQKKAACEDELATVDTSSSGDGGDGFIILEW